MTRCTIEETADGKLLILANISEAAEKTVAGALAKKLLEGSQAIMSEITGQSPQIERMS